MKLSVVIVTWNTALITKRCLDSVKRYLPHCQVIIVDNGSTDNTQKLLSADKSIKYVFSEKNLGFAKGNNLGVQSAQGEYLLFLNSDMELIDNSLESMFEYIQKHREIGVIGPKFLNPDLTPQSSVFPPQSLCNAFKEFWLGQVAYSKYLPQKLVPHHVWALSGGCMLIKKDYFLSLGGWNEKYFMYYEDLDLCRQVRKTGSKIVYYPSALVVHRHGASGKNLADSANQWRRLIPGSKLYHGQFVHYLLFLISWSGQKIHSLFSTK